MNEHVPSTPRERLAERARETGDPLLVAVDGLATLLRDGEASDRMKRAAWRSMRLLADATEMDNEAPDAAQGD